MKEAGFVEQILVALVMIPTVIGRVLSLAPIFAFFMYYGTLIVFVVAGFLGLVVVIQKRQGQTQYKYLFLGVLTSFTSPCIIANDQSYHLLHNGLLGTCFNIAFIWILYGFAPTFRLLFPNVPTALQCTYTQHFVVPFIIRCPK